jgi:hypothetical protein
MRKKRTGQRNDSGMAPFYSFDSSVESFVILKIVNGVMLRVCKDTRKKDKRYNSIRKNLTIAGKRLGFKTHCNYPVNLPSDTISQGNRVDIAWIKDDKVIVAIAIGCKFKNDTPLVLSASDSNFKIWIYYGIDDPDHHEDIFIIRPSRQDRLLPSGRERRLFRTPQLSNKLTRVIKINYACGHSLNHKIKNPYTSEGFDEIGQLEKEKCPACKEEIPF